jgi:hypothetical protein
MVTRNEAIVLHLRELSDLLNQDPSPLSHGAIRPEAETYSARKAKQLCGTGPIRLVLEFPNTQRFESDWPHRSRPSLFPWIFDSASGKVIRGNVWVA